MPTARAEKSQNSVFDAMLPLNREKRPVATTSATKIGEPSAPRNATTTHAPRASRPKNPELGTDLRGQIVRILVCTHRSEASDALPEHGCGQECPLGQVQV